MSTEAKLWSTLRAALPRGKGVRYTRIETGLIQAGVADVEYVHPPYHGWIELKVGLLSPHANAPLRLRHPFSFAQWAWLLTHDRPRDRLRSWLLVGVAARTAPGWHAFVLCTAPAAVFLLEGRRALPYAVLLAQPGVKAYNRPRQVLEAIACIAKAKGLKRSKEQ